MFVYGIINPDNSMAYRETAESVKAGAACLLWDVERNDGDPKNGATKEALAMAEERLRDIIDRAEASSPGFRFMVGRYTYFCESRSG